MVREEKHKIQVNNLIIVFRHFMDRMMREGSRAYKQVSNSKWDSKKILHHNVVMLILDIDKPRNNRHFYLMNSIYNIL